MAIISSADYLFFLGDKRVDYWNQETGPLFLFEIIPMIIGFYSLIFDNRRWSRVVLCWFILTIIVTSCFKYQPDFIVSLIIILPLQVIILAGFNYLADRLSVIKRNPVMMLLAFLLIALSMHEVISYFHIMLIHYPKRLLVQ